MSNTSTKPKKSNWRFKTLRLRDLKKLQITNELDHIIREFSNQRETSNESLILPGLWLGNKYTAKDIDFVTNNKIKYIINITDDINNEFDFISYTNFKIRDIMACENSRKETEIDTLGILRRGSKIINTALGNNMSVLVHCKRGHHRSASIIAFYLMKYHHYTLPAALRLIKTIRPRAFRRRSCMMDTLIDYETNRYIDS